METSQSGFSAMARQRPGSDLPRKSLQIAIRGGREAHNRPGHGNLLRRCTLLRQPWGLSSFFSPDSIYPFVGGHIFLA